MQVLGAIIT